MNALTERDQLIQKHNELNELLGFVVSQRQKAQNKYENKRDRLVIWNFGGKLEDRRKEKLNWDKIYNVIQAYRELIIKRLNESV